jgi:iron complex transport system substrate-binding protein
MKSIYIMIALCCLSACSQNKSSENEEKRIVCLAKQYNELIYALHAEKDLVGVDLSSVYPAQINKLPKLGYHRALSAEAILSANPTLIIHDDNIGPDHVVRQLENLKIPMKVFASKANDVASTKALMLEMGKYFHKEQVAQKLAANFEREVNAAKQAAKQYHDKPSVLIIHFGQAKNHYLLVTQKSTAAKMIDWAGGKLSVTGEKGMRVLSAEAIAMANPDVILMTDFGFDRLGSLEKIKTLPGLAETKAAKENKIYRVNEFDLMYLGPRTGKNTIILEKLIHAN